ncbi:MAG: electron transfer flavoprotein subunit alpha, partial [Selenomonadaceae bacterium]
MAKLVVHQDKIDDISALLAICPFGAIEEKNGEVSIGAACKMCRLCVKNGPTGAVEFVPDEEVAQVDKSQWKGIAVYVDHVDGIIHPVTYELIGKAKELAAKIGQPVYALFMGSNIGDKSRELLHYGADKVFVYDKQSLEYFKV